MPRQALAVRQFSTSKRISSRHGTHSCLHGQAFSEKSDLSHFVGLKEDVAIFGSSSTEWWTVENTAYDSTPITFKLFDPKLCHRFRISNRCEILCTLQTEYRRQHRRTSCRLENNDNLIKWHHAGAFATVSSIITPPLRFQQNFLPVEH